MSDKSSDFHFPKPVRFKTKLPLIDSNLDANHFFSDGGKSLACIDDSTDHVLTVWDWEKTDGAEKLYETKTTKEFHQIITVESVKVYIMNITE